MLDVCGRERKEEARLGSCLPPSYTFATQPSLYQPSDLYILLFFPPPQGILYLYAAAMYHSSSELVIATLSCHSVALTHPHHLSWWTALKQRSRSLEDLVGLCVFLLPPSTLPLPSSLYEARRTCTRPLWQPRSTVYIANETRRAKRNETSYCVCKF